MNKTAIKNYAIWARVQLIEAVKQKAFEYEVTGNGEYKYDLDSAAGRLLTKTEKEQRQKLLDLIRQKGFEQVMEEAAYTWFNRFIALRFMEVNGYLPSKVRVFTDENGTFKPEIMKQAMTVDLDGLDREIVFDLLDKQNNEELYKYLLITQCNALHKGLPGMFEKIGAWTELLFPKNLLRDDSVIAKMISDIPEEDWKEQVEIIGWLYQYYNTEPKDKVFSRPSGQKIRKEDVPAATQLFTPDWIVRYMVENSLGRTWTDIKPDTDLKSEWKYYLSEAEQSDDVQTKLLEMRKSKGQTSVEEITFLDPCMGSGHILVYAFDVFMQIYTSLGYTERDAAQKIVENNLYGLELDDRAAQLAYFAVMMKARSYDRRFLGRGIRPNLCSIQESNNINPDYLELFGELKETARKLYDEFIDAKEYGSILNLKITAEEIAQLEEKCSEIIDGYYENIFDSIRQVGIRTDFPALIRQAKIMVKKYEVVCTNPPYMGGGFSPKLDAYIKKYYADSKSDLFAVFIEKGNSWVACNGYNCMVTMQSWMFLSSYEKMRKKILANTTITNLMHMENMVMGIAFGTAVTVFYNKHIRDYRGTYNQIKLCDIENGHPKEFPVMANRFAQVSTDNFSKIPGSPVAYWVSENFIRAFENKKIGDYALARNGMKTGSNGDFVRLWWEIINNKMCFNALNAQEAIASHCKWFPYNKGGEYHKWYGNNDCVLNWENCGERVIGKAKLEKRNVQDYPLEMKFKPLVTWSLITSSIPSFRFKQSCICDIAGMSFWDTSKRDMLYYLLGICNTKIALFVLNMIAPTINFQAGDISRIPIIYDSKQKPLVDDLVLQNIESCKQDWDSFETSWDFERHPLVVFKTKTGFVPINSYSIRDTYMAWESLAETRWLALKANEEELNRIFIDIYGLQDELTPEVEDKDVTVRKADLTREIKSLISYAVGCMFGRYSLDVDGLAYAGGEWDNTKYKSFIPDDDNIIPICDDEYFEDDIVGRFVEFVRVVYGEDTLEENLRFIADALGGKGTSREVIRSYFINGFYADHVKIYQKRPIYWLFSSGKKNGFKALIYLHRYQPDTLARIRTDYVHEQQERYRTQLQMLDDRLNKASASEKVRLNKQIAKLKEQALEIQQYEEKIHHLADQMIAIDLDDGVKVNYARFQDVLEKIK